MSACLYSAVSLTCVREQRFISMFFCFVFCLFVLFFVVVVVLVLLFIIV